MVGEEVKLAGSRVWGMEVRMRAGEVRSWNG